MAIGHQRRLTERQAFYLGFIAQYTWLAAQAPSEGDIATFFGVRPPSAHGMLCTLERNGWIRRTPGAARSIRLVPPVPDLPLVGSRRYGARDNDPISFLVSFARSVIASYLGEDRIYFPKVGVAQQMVLRLADRLVEMGASSARIARVVRELDPLEELLYRPKPQPDSPPTAPGAAKAAPKPPPPRPARSRAREPEPAQRNLFDRDERALQHEGHLEEPVGESRRAAFNRVLAKVPARPPDPDDTF